MEAQSAELVEVVVDDADRLGHILWDEDYFEQSPACSCERLDYYAEVVSGCMAGLTSNQHLKECSRLSKRGVALGMEHYCRGQVG